MKYKIVKNENDEFVMTVLIDANGASINPPGVFSYVDFINYLYNQKGKRIDFEFDGLSNDETNKILTFMDDVYKIFNVKDHDNSSQSNSEKNDV